MGNYCCGNNPGKDEHHDMSQTSSSTLSNQDLSSISSQRQHQQHQQHQQQQYMKQGNNTPPSISATPILSNEMTPPQPSPMNSSSQMSTSPIHTAVIKQNTMKSKDDQVMMKSMETSHSNNNTSPIILILGGPGSGKVKYIVFLSLSFFLLIFFLLHFEFLFCFLPIISILSQ